MLTAPASFAALLVVGTASVAGCRGNASDDGAASSQSCSVSDGGVSQIASGQASPWGIATSRTGAYWADNSNTDRGAIVGAGLCGGPVQTLAANEEYATEVAVDDAFVYWIVDGTSANKVRKVALDGGLAQTVSLTPPPTSWSRVVVDDAYVYYAGEQGTTCGIARVTKAGGQATFLTTDGCDGPLAVDSDNVYFGGGGAIWSVPKDGGPTTELAVRVGTALVAELAIDGSAVYWATTTSGASDARDDWTLMSVGKRGGTAVTLASGTAPISALAVYSGYVYWANEDGELERLPARGGRAAVIARGQFSAGLAPGPGFIVWTTLDANDGGVFRLAP